MYRTTTGGWIEIICGSMFSGKSEELIRRVRWAQLAKQNVLVFKPEIDKRYHENAIVSHNGTMISAHAVQNSTEIFEFDKEEIDVIAIDEVQFFDEGIIEVVTNLANEGYRIILAGLDQDFRGIPFAPMPSLLAVAEKITKLHAVCTVCGQAASRTQRLVDGKPAHREEPIILIGAKEAYEARCRQHHIVPSEVTNVPS